MKKRRKIALAAGAGALGAGIALTPSANAATGGMLLQAASVKTPAPQDALRDGGVWYFKAKHSGKCLTVHGASTAKGAAVDQYTCLHRANQRWRLLFVSDRGLAYVTAEHSGKCLDVLGGSKANGTKIGQWDCNSRKNQKFFVKSVAGYATIQPWYDAQKCLDVPGASQRNNTQLVLWSCNYGSNQKFKMVRA